MVKDNGDHRPLRHVQVIIASLERRKAEKQAHTSIVEGSANADSISTLEIFSVSPHHLVTLIITSPILATLKV